MRKFLRAAREALCLRRTALAIYYGLEGIRAAMRRERSFLRIALIEIALVVTIFLFCPSISLIEVCILVLAFAGVLVAELLNTGLEKLLDLIELDQHPIVKYSKDAAAGAVLIAAISGLITVSLIAVKHIIQN